MMDIRSIPLDYPSEVMARAESTAIGIKQFIGYLQAVEEDIMLRVFAYRKLKKGQLQITEVMRRITQKNGCVFKNLYGGSRSGYQPVYEREDKVISSYGYPITVFDKKHFDNWQKSEVLGIGYTLINSDMLKDTRFKYCGYSPDVRGDVIDYLNAYIENPCVEFFGKMGLKPSKSLMDKVKKDRQFRSWLIKHYNEVYLYGPKAAVYAYQNNLDCEEARRRVYKMDKFFKEVAGLVPEVRGTKLNREKVFEYAEKVGYSSYNDYLKAIKELKYDLEDTKNVYPYDFVRMHDMRIAEYESALAKIDERKRKKLYRQFRARAKEAKQFEYKNDSFAAIIPKNIPDLQKEGKVLGHCVGNMGYDKKMADGEIIIVFIRPLIDMLSPNMTIEYSLSRKRILQAQGKSRRCPTKEEQAFIDEWEKRTTESLKRGELWLNK